MSGLPVSIKMRPVAQTPKVADGDITFENVAAIVLKNAGTATVNLWNGMYTLDSKETISFNVTEDSAIMDIINIPVTFDTSTGAVKLLQIVLLKSSYC